MIGKKIKRIFSNWWFVSVSTSILLLALFVFALPIFVDFLRPLLIKLLCVVLIIIFWVGWFLLRRRKSRKKEDELSTAIMPDKADEEAKALQARLKTALTKLRSQSNAKGNYLYSCPWYVIIGPPGAGKTTALLNSGLRFPFSDQSFEGSGGTRNLDFLFAEEAVLVDTAGRYTTQDSDSNVDRRGWETLLKLLKKFRPLEPINAVFVAIPIDDLQRGDVRQIDEHAALVRQRLYEIRIALETDLPVYLLLTKGDLLAGFTEYFEDLDVDGRRAVLGHTFDIESNISPELVAKAFDQFTNNVDLRRPKRLQEELDIRRRGLILGFPSQLHKLRSSLCRFVEGAFLSENREKGRFRGFYITSGLQDGNTLDRILDSYASPMDDEQSRVGRSSRAFFLNRLLTEVVFSESGLPIPDNGLIRRRKKKIVSSIAAMSLAACMLFIAWGISFVGNRNFQKNTIESVAQIEEEIELSRLSFTEVGTHDASLEEVMIVLDMLRDLPEGYNDRLAGGPSLSNRFGLFQSGLSRRNREAYHNGLRRTLLPRIMLRLETKIQENLNDPVAVYEPLKSYLMLGGAAPNGKVDAKSVKYAVEKDWAQELFPGSQLRPVRDRLSLHLEALLEDRNLLSAWTDRQAPMDSDLIAEARLSIRQLSLAELAYAIMRERAANLEGDWRMNSILQKNDALAFAEPEKVMNITVPYFFTRDGFDKSFSIRLLKARDLLEDELWVLGESAENVSVDREIGNLRSGITLTYVSEYIEHWQNVIDSLEPGDYFNDPTSYRTFRKAPSPLKKAFYEVRDNTTFSDGVGDAVGDIVLERAKRNRAVKTASRIAENTPSRGLEADSLISNHFLDLNQWIGNGDEPSGVDDLVNTISQTMETVLADRNQLGGNGARSQSSNIARLQRLSLEVPELASGFVDQVAKGGNAAQLKVRQKDLEISYQRQIYPFCQQAVDGFYPFTRRSRQDATLKDVRSAFGSGGKLTQFMDQNLTPLLNKTNKVWSWDRRVEVTKGFSNASAFNLQKAQNLSDVFSEGLPLEIKLLSASSNIDYVELNINGTSIEMSPGESEEIIWQLEGGVVRTSELRAIGQDKIVWQQKDRGTWSLFRILDRSKISYPAKNFVTARFASEGSEFELQIFFPEKLNPFAGNGLWSVNCVSRL